MYLAHPAAAGNIKAMLPEVSTGQLQHKQNSFEKHKHVVPKPP